VLSGKNTLLEIETYAILTQHFSVELALYLLDELIDSIPEDEVTFECWVRVQI
jgi:hypothetical protein